MPDTINTRRARYGFAAQWYDCAAWLYTFGGIQRSKAVSVQQLGPGMRVLYPGAGTGRDAALAAGSGAEVWVSDLSEAMVGKARKRLSPELSERVHFLHGDIMDLHYPAFFDVIAAHYLLDVFDADTMPAVAAHLAGMLKPGGSLLIAGFTPPEGGMPRRFFSWVYHALPMLFFHVFARNALHPVYDYTPTMRALGFIRMQTQQFYLIHPWLPSVRLWSGFAGLAPNRGTDA